MNDHRPSRRSIVLWFLGVCLFACLLRWPIAAVPLERDEGEYAYIAQRWALGEVPYRDSFDQKPPGVFAAYAVIQRILGESPDATHWGALVVTLGTLVCVAVAGRQLGGPVAGGAGAVVAAHMVGD